VVVFVLPCNYLVLGEHLALPHSCAHHQPSLLDACCNAVISEGGLKLVKANEVGHDACCRIPLLPISLSLVLKLLGGVILIGLFSQRCCIIEWMVALLKLMYCFFIGAKASLPTPYRTSSFPASCAPRYLVYASAFPYVAQGSNLDGLRSLLLQELQLHMHLD
jgi:hypothetical protein